MAACVPLPPLFQEKTQSKQNTSGTHRTPESAFNRKCIQLKLVFQPHTWCWCSDKTFLVSVTYRFKYPTSFHLVRKLQYAHELFVFYTKSFKSSFKSVQSSRINTHTGEISENKHKVNAGAQQFKKKSKVKIKNVSLYNKSLLCYVRVCVCVRACRNTKPCVTSQTATPLQLVCGEKQPGRSSHDAQVSASLRETSPPERGRGAAECVRSESLVPAVDARAAIGGLLAPRAASFVPSPSSQFLGYYRRSRVPGGR